MKIAFLTSFNADFIKKDFDAFLIKNSIRADCWWNGFNLQEQSVFDLTSSLYSFQPEIIFVHYEVESLLGNLAYDLLSFSIEERRKQVEDILTKLKHVIGTINENLPKTKIVFQNFIVRSASPLGLLDSNISLGMDEILLELNTGLFQLKDEYKDRLVIHNYAELVSKQGKDSVFDFRLFRLAKYPFATHFNEKLCEHYFDVINVLTDPRKKCIVLDLDNTLWGGIVGQDGFENIQLGSSGIGESFLQFQKILLNFYRRGIFLAVCSKNNYDDAMEVIEKHPDMILRKELFSKIEINWLDKAANLKSIANNLNIGTDALVFLDDNPAECELVKQQIPEVEVVNLTGDPDNYILQLLSVRSLQTITITEEDAGRNIMHAADEKRKEFENTFTILDDYYRSLEMQAFVHINDKSEVPRVSQLTQKTNQFNISTKRYSNEEVLEFATRGTHNVYSLRLIDKFGDNGIVVVAIVEKGKADWFIDTLLMSCRVIGRQAETALLNTIIDDAIKAGVKSIYGIFIPTKKNSPAAEFFQQHGFNKESDTNWRLIIPAEKKNHFIKINLEV